MPLSHLTRSLKHRNYRLFFSGQSVSLVGTWITRVATSWLVYRLTGSELLLGDRRLLRADPDAAARAVRRRAGRPLGPPPHARHHADPVDGAVAGARACSRWRVDHGRGNPRAADRAGDHQRVRHARRGRRSSSRWSKTAADLPNAIALNSSMVNGSRIIGPSIGGHLIAAVGEGWCFCARRRSRTSSSSRRCLRCGSPHARAPPRPARDVRRGAAARDSVTSCGSVPIRTALLLLALVSADGDAVHGADAGDCGNVLHGGPHTLGLLMTATGVGALAGALYLASRPSVLGLGRVDR